MPPPPAWTRATRFARLVHVTRCASTQDLALAEPEPGCAVYWADHQTAGRGRQGRGWHDTEAEDLALSFRLHGIRLPRPERLPAAVSLAVLEVLERVLGRTLRLKWPNDVLADGHKLAGILIDSVSQPPLFAIGVGINVNSTRFPPELAERATSLALLSGRTTDRAALVGELAVGMDAMVSHLERDAGEALHARFAARMGLLGQHVAITVGAEEIPGRVAAMDLDSIRLTDGRTFLLAAVQRLRPT